MFGTLKLYRFCTREIVTPPTCVPISISLGVAVTPTQPELCGYRCEDSAHKRLIRGSVSRVRLRLRFFALAARKRGICAQHMCLDGTEFANFLELCRGSVRAPANWQHSRPTSQLTDMVRTLRAKHPTPCFVGVRLQSTQSTILFHPITLHTFGDSAFALGISF